MNATSRKVCIFGLLLLAGGLWLLAGQSLAAGDDNRLPPVPKELPPPPSDLPLKTDLPTKTPPSTSPFREEKSKKGPTVAEDDDSAIACDLALCDPPGKVWMRADYLMWWTSGSNLPPLVTTSPNGTAPAEAGVLDATNTSTIFGSQTVNSGGRSGYRTLVGMWLDPCHVWGTEFDYLNLGERSNTFDQTSLTGDPILARPFFNMQTGVQDRQLVAYANQPSQRDLATGSMWVEAKDYFQSIGVSLSYNLCSGPSYDEWTDSCDLGSSCATCDVSCDTSASAPVSGTRRTDLLIGLRYYNLSDRVAMRENMRNLVNLYTYGIQDDFSAKNNFYGGEVGLRTRFNRGCWSLDVLTKVALGNNNRTVIVAGQTDATSPNGSTRVYGAGLLADSTNGGTRVQNTFTMIPQLSLDLGYQVNCHWRAYVGYSVLYWGGVSRAADQISLFVDPRNVPSSSVYNPSGALPFPQAFGATTNFWAHGINTGTEFRF
jgi:hypothetical protein